jgi:predicted transcriptional regulator
MGWITDLLKDLPLSALQREKLLSAEKEIGRLQSLVDQKNSEIVRLQFEATQKEAETKELHQRLHEATSIPEPEEAEVSVLEFLARNRDGTRLQSLAQASNCSEAKTAYHLLKLCKANLVNASYSLNQGCTFYTLAAGGLEYLGRTERL